MPYALSDQGLVVAYLYGPPLAVRDLGSNRDKILWFVKDTDSDELHLTGHLAGSAHPVLSQTVSGPDGIPSDVTAPDPGWWRLTLAWTSGDDSYRDSINLEYLAHG